MRILSFEQQTETAGPTAAARASDQGPEGLLGETRHAELWFRIRSDGPVMMTDAPGSLWHGLLGLGLRRVACVQHPDACARACARPDDCGFGRLFHPRGRPAQGFYAEAAVPPPYTVRSETRGNDPTDHVVRIALIGDAVERKDEVSAAIAAGICSGIGRSRVQAKSSSMGTRISKLVDDVALEVAEATSAGASHDKADANVDPQPLRSVRVELLTPLRLKRQGEPAGTVEYRDLLTAILRRVSLLAFHHGEGARCETWSPSHELMEQARAVRTRARDTHWLDLHRYSGSQQRSMPLGGLVGGQVFEAVPREHLPWLAAGALLGVGHGCSFGLGALRWSLL